MRLYTLRTVDNEEVTFWLHHVGPVYPGKRKVVLVSGNVLRVTRTDIKALLMAMQEQRSVIVAI